MESRARLFGHSIHQMLIVFPLGLLGTSVIFDAVGLWLNDTRWPAMSFYMMGFGVAFGLLAALFGWIDYFAIPAGTRAKKVGLWHGCINVLVLLMFGLSWFIRAANHTTPNPAAYLLSTGAMALVLVSGWLGGELVSRLGIGVSDHAGFNAPNSIKEPVVRPR